jgi:hypothetical protein
MHMTKDLSRVYEILHNVHNWSPTWIMSSSGHWSNLAYNHAVNSQSFPNGHYLVFDKL